MNDMSDFSGQFGHREPGISGQPNHLADALARRVQPEAAPVNVAPVAPASKAASHVLG